MKKIYNLCYNSSEYNHAEIIYSVTEMFMKLLGIDVGSTTVKAAVIDENGNLNYSSYVRHFANVKQTVLAELNTIKQKFGGEYCVSITGSGGETESPLGIT